MIIIVIVYVHIFKKWNMNPQKALTLAWIVSSNLVMFLLEPVILVWPCAVMSRNTQTICISSVKEPVAEYNLLTILIVDFKNVVKSVG